MIKTDSRYFTSRGGVLPNGFYLLKVRKVGDAFSMQVVDTIHTRVVNDYTKDKLADRNQLVGMIEDATRFYSFNVISGLYNPEEKPDQDEDINGIVMSLREAGLASAPNNQTGENGKRKLR